jgi:hypothetical protein
MQFPQKEKVITVKQNEYKVTFPNNRGLMAIYSRKAVLSKEMYDALKFGMDGNSRYVAMLIDTIAILEQIMPEQFTKDLNVQNILEGDIIMGAELVRVYQEQLKEWFDQWSDAIASVLNPKKEENKNNAA